MTVRIRVDWMALQAASALDSGRQIVRNAAMEFHPWRLVQIRPECTCAAGKVRFGWKADSEA